MKTFVIAKDTGAGEEDVVFWGRVNGVEMWTEQFPEAIVWFVPSQAVNKADGLRVTCHVVEDYGIETQDIYESFFEEGT